VKTISKTIFIFLVTTLMSISASNIFAGNIVLGKFGATYRIAEKNALIEIQERAAKIDWAKTFSSNYWDTRVMDYKPDGLISLPRAAASRSFLVNMSEPLIMDIPKVDGQGRISGILYPAGYVVNPLEYIQFQYKMVFINGDDPKQIEWLKKSGYSKDIMTIVLLTDGSYIRASQALGNIPVFYAYGFMVKKLKLRAVPSIAVQEGRFMKVIEVNVNEKISTRKNSSK
jgi:conjugal transfer pilus assembly protein TraW